MSKIQIENTKEARDEHDHWYGSQDVTLTDGDLQHLKEGGAMGIVANDEYVVWLSRAPESTPEEAADEKAVKYDEIRDTLWRMAVHGNLLASMLAANLIREFRIEGPNGEPPDYA